MKFIHTADLHLDSPFLGLQNTPAELRDRILNSTFAAFHRIVDDALADEVDFVVIAGDIYDRDEHSVRAEDLFIQECERLEERHIPVYLSYGNHDYQQVDPKSTLLPSNVNVFGNQVETKTLTTNRGETVAITGFSYGTQWVTEDRTGDYPPKGAVDWQIGLLHGSLSGLKTPHDNYAPFSEKELVEKGYDYWALGHIHKRQVISDQPWIIYSGNPQGRHKNEPGEKGYYLVESTEDGLQPTFKPVAELIWQTLELSIQAPLSGEALQTQILQQLSAFEVDQTALLTIRLVSDVLAADVQQQVEKGLLLGRLQRAIAKTAPLRIWPVDLSVIVSEQQPTFNALDTAYWDAAATDIFTADNLTATAGKLFDRDFIEMAFQSEAALQQLKQQILVELANGQEGQS